MEVPAQLGCWWCPELEEERAAWLCSFIVDDPSACVRWIMQSSTLLEVFSRPGLRCVVVLLQFPLCVGVVQCSASIFCSVRVFLILYSDL